MSSFPYAQIQVGNQPTRPHAGQLTDASRSYCEDLPNPGITFQSVAITVTAPTLGQALTLTANGEAVSVVSTGVAATDGAALRAAAAANPVFRSMFEPSGAGALVTLTGQARAYNIAVEVSLPAVLVAVNTAASEGTTFASGVALFFTSGVPALAPPAGTDATNIVDRLLGITTRRYNVEGTTQANNSGLQPPSPRRVEVLTSGRIGVADGASAAYRDPLYIGTGANAGRLFNAAGSDRVLMPASFAHWYGPYEVILRYGR